MKLLIIAVAALLSPIAWSDVTYNGAKYPMPTDTSRPVKTPLCLVSEVQALLNRAESITLGTTETTAVEIRQVFSQLLGCRRGQSDVDRLTISQALYDLTVVYSELH